jgi:hypothetical protein
MIAIEWRKNWLKDSGKYRKMLPLLFVLFIPGGTILAALWFFVWGIRFLSSTASHYLQKPIAELARHTPEP